MKIKYNPTYAIDYLPIIEDLNPYLIYLVRSESKYGEAGILLQLNDNTFKILPRTYRISSIVGDTGRLQMKSFYYLIQELDKKYFGRVQSRTIKEEEFNSLFDDRLKPEDILDQYRSNSYWIDDFKDIKRKYGDANQYLDRHGEEFIKAQDILKDLIEATV